MAALVPDTGCLSVVVTGMMELGLGSKPITVLDRKRFTADPLRHLVVYCRTICFRHQVSGIQESYSKYCPPK